LSKLDTESGLNLFYEPDYSRTKLCIEANDAKVAFIEAAETGDNGVAQCLEICAAIRNDAKNCKLILMCPNQDEEAVAQTLNAKQDGKIDDFVFYEASLDYISSKIVTMLNN